MHSQPATVLLIPLYGVGFPPPEPMASGDIAVVPFPDRPDRPPAGTLRLEVQPWMDLQVFVDGHFVGSSTDFNGELTLEAGRHAIEIRAPAHEPLRFDVNVTPHQSITYRGSLQPATTAQPSSPTPQPLPEVAPARATTFYLIPGCYAGNVPPEDAGLPATCDQSRVVTFTP